MEVSGQLQTPNRFTPLRRRPQYPLNKGLDEAQCLTGRFTEENTFLTPARIQITIFRTSSPKPSHDTNYAISPSYVEIVP
jgi:hypothetical protein